MRIRIFYVLVITIVMTSFHAFAQEKGVHFEPMTENWYQILQRAQKEDKDIFIDCYATWCGPCKMMDREVYPNDTVGQFMNAHFISVRVQMDKTKGDDQLTKNWYGTAETLAKSYAITEYPTMLILSPKGEPLHKMVGTTVKEPSKAFLKAATDGLNPHMQYYSILKNYKPGTLDTSELKGLAVAVRAYNDTLAAKLALDYLWQIPADNLFTDEHMDYLNRFKANGKVKTFIEKKIAVYQSKDYQDEPHLFLLTTMKLDTNVQKVARHYLDGLSEQALLDTNYLQLIAAFRMTMNVHDRYYKLLDLEPEKVDSVMHKNGYAQYVADDIVNLSIIQPKQMAYDSAQTDPDWHAIKEKVKQEAGEKAAERNVSVTAQYRFYRVEVFNAEQAHNDKRFFWGPKLATTLCATVDDRQVAAYPNDKANYASIANNLSDHAWIIFQYSNDKKELNRALFWVNKALDICNHTDAADVDTKANVLYKLGQKSEALKLEARAVKMQPNDDSIANAYHRMQEGKPTWPMPKNE